MSNNPEKLRRNNEQSELCSFFFSFFWHEHDWVGLIEPCSLQLNGIRSVDILNSIHLFIGALLRKNPTILIRNFISSPHTHHFSLLCLLIQFCSLSRCINGKLTQYFPRLNIKATCGLVAYASDWAKTQKHTECEWVCIADILSICKHIHIR